MLSPGRSHEGEVKEKHYISTADEDSDKDINNDNEYGNNTHVELSLREEVRKTVMELLLEIKDNDNVREDFEFSDKYQYSEEETENE